MSQKKIIGIDLGTTNSCIGVWKDGKVEIITNDQGNRTTPSFVAFTQNDILIGDAAKNQMASNPKNTIYDIKRLMGKKMNDITVQEDIKHWPFNVVDVNGKPYIKAEYQNQTKFYSPEQISSMILSKLKQDASAFLGEEITDAIITVPAYFNDTQRQATKDAGRIAGLNVVRIINEPTAAALSYGLEKNKEHTNVLIFDCGGGTHDITLLSLENGIFEVKSTGGDSHLGGEDIDNLLVAYCASEFNKKYKIDPYSSPKSIRRLKSACEKAKHVLSSATQTNIEIDLLIDGIDFSISLSRAKFESICDQILKKTLEPLDQVLKDGKIKKTEVNEIVLVGGSTRIPKIRKLLSEYFDNKKLNESVNPDEGVAYGAAIQAAILSGIDDKKLNDIILIDVTPLSVGIETSGGIMTKLIERNTPIPCTKSRIFSTYSDNQTNVTILIYEGERSLTKDNHQLGMFNLSGINPAPRGVPQIEVTFNIDTNGILNVTAIDKASRKSGSTIIANSNRHFTEDQIQSMILEAQKYEEEDKMKKRNIDARNDLENYAHSVSQSMNNPEIQSYITLEDKEQLNTVISNLIIYIEENPSEDKNVYDNMRKTLENIWNPIVIQMYKDINEKSSQVNNEKSVPINNEEDDAEEEENDE